MAQDPINNWIDVPALQKQADAADNVFAKLFDDIKKGVSDVNKMQITIGNNNSAGGSAAGYQQLLATLAQLANNTQTYTEKLRTANRERQFEMAGRREALQLQKEVARQTQEEARITAELSDSYKQLELSAKAQTDRFRQLAASLGLNHQLTQEALRDANSLNGQVAAINRAYGNYRDNVGNYASATNALGFSIRNIASELPNLGISLRTFGQSISNNITPFYQSIKELVAQNKLLREQGQPTVSILRAIGKEFFSLGTFINLTIIAGLKLIEYFEKQNKAVQGYQKYLQEAIKTESDGIGKLYELQKALSDTTISREKQLEVFNRVKKEYPQYFQDLSFEDDALTKINKTIQEQIQLRIENAKAVAAQKNVADATQELIKAQQALTQDTGFWDRIVAGWTAIRVSYDDLTDSAKKLFDAEVLKNKAMGNGATISNVALAKISALSDAEKKLSDAVNLSLNPLNEHKVAIENEIKVYEEKYHAVGRDIVGFEKINAAHERERENIRAHIFLLDLQLDAINKNIEARERQLVIDKHLKDEDEIALMNEKNKVLATKEGTKERLEAEVVYINERKKQQLTNLKNEYGSDILLVQQNQEYQIRRINIERTANDEIDKLRDAFARKHKPKKQKKVNTGDDGDVVKSAMDELTLISDRITQSRDENLRELLASLSTGEITVAEYEARRKEMMKQNEDEILQEQLKYLKYRLEAIGLNAENAQKIQEKYTELHKSEIQKRFEADETAALTSAKNLEGFQAAMLKAHDKATKELEQKEKKRNSLIKAQAKELLNDIMGFLRAQSDAEISRLNKQNDANKDYYDQRRQAVEDSSKTDKEKADLTKQLDEEERARKAEIDAEIAQQKRKQAIFDKAQAIADIAIKTSQAIISAVAASPLTGGLPWSAIAAAIGAAQAALVIATPIPEYAVGKDASDPYTGKMKWGEAGTEAKIDRHGRLTWATKPTWGYTEAGDTIISNRDLRHGALDEYFPDLSTEVDIPGMLNGMAAIQSDNTKKIVRAIKGIKSAQGVSERVILAKLAAKR